MNRHRFALAFDTLESKFSLSGFASFDLPPPKPEPDPGPYEPDPPIVYPTFPPTGPEGPG